MKGNKGVRLQTALSRAGVTSRRNAVSVIEEGRVRVNGRVVRRKGHRVDPDKDRITVDEKVVRFKRKIYILLNKPKGLISSRRDPRGRKTVFDILPREFAELHTVGRLDRDTTGLLLLTNDGDFTYKLTHPKFEIRKKYRVLCKGDIQEKEIRRLQRGMMIDGKKTARADVKIIKSGAGESDVLIEIHEGRKRQIRNMFLFLGHPPKRLERVAYEFLKLGSLKSGRFRYLRDEEVRRLKAL